MNSYGLSGSNAAKQFPSCPRMCVYAKASFVGKRAPGGGAAHHGAAPPAPQLRSAAHE